MKRFVASQVSALFALLVLSAAGVQADTVLAPLNATGSGWYTASNHSSPTYVVGDPGYQYHNYFTFDLTSVTAQITGASLRLYTYDCVSPSANTKVENYELHQASPPLSYGDLADGPVYGGIGLTGQDGGKYVVIPLNSSFLSAANAARGAGSIALGGLITNLGTDPVPEKLFGYQPATADAPQLNLTVVPLPAAVWPGLAALVGLAVMRAVKRRGR